MNGIKTSMEARMRKVFWVLGCLLAASQANAEPYDCRTIKAESMGFKHRQFIGSTNWYAT